MIVKFHARGTGKGSGPVDYLLGRERNREGAILLRGNPDQTEALIDSSRFAKRYTSGVLSFAEADLPPEAKNALMDDFEASLLPGLDADQYECLWVEHRDKGRLELNFVIPNIELQSGKRLQPYYDRADRPRVDAWQTIVNDRYQLHDPNDPANQRALNTPSNLPRDRALAQRQLTDGLLALAEKGLITNRAQVVSTLEEAGFEVTRQTKNSISIADPENGRPMRLQGKLYERDFTLSNGLREEIDRASREYRESREQRVREARERLARGIEHKREENQRSYRRAVPEVTASSAEKLDSRHAPRDAGDHPRGWDIGTHGHVHQAPGGRDTRAERHAPDAERPGGSDDTDALRQQPETVREDRQERHRLRRERRIQDTGGVLNDRFRAGAFERIRELTEHLRTTAAGITQRLRKFAADVCADTSREQAVGRADQALERTARQVEIKRLVLDERRKEAVKQQERARQAPSPKPKFYGPSM
ncbi:hypothetical protein AC401_25300 [Salmonella enterica subsp. enterica]|nr:hypothetical protein [Salmonella enterica subsp. enterica]EAA5882275.1 hypothetical protein [Salmonella enterica subsp. enterica]EAW1821955.1 hypothetical protein [Salmonella enterica subsp. enterica]EAW1836376.1 hypothetical protein [Salmonella enterica subsp. enterica]EAW1845945.1 hypothetical protein [Salmonella enterica subsp. enterica]